MKKYLVVAYLSAISSMASAYESTGMSGVDETTGYGKKIGYAVLFIIGIVGIVSGIWQMASENGSGKKVGASLIGIGILTFGILALWVSKASGFSF